MVNKKKYKQFPIITLEDGCFVLQSLIIPVVIYLGKIKSYAGEVEKVFNTYKPDDLIPARVYDPLHDKVLYQQRELLKFIADHQSSSFSYINLRPLLTRKGFLKRELHEESKRTLNELLDIRNWSFHNVQSMITADSEIANKSIPPELKGFVEIKPMLNPVIIKKVKSYTWSMMSSFIVHNDERANQFETILSEMKKDYQEMYEALLSNQIILTETGWTSEVQYVEQEVNGLNPHTAGSDISSLSMGIQKGKYDGTDESLKKWTE